MKDRLKGTWLKIRKYNNVYNFYCGDVIDLWNWNDLCYIVT